MSTIVVVRKGGRAVIAADTQSSYGSLKFDSRYHIQSDKIRKAGASYVAVAGPAVHESVLESLAKRHPRTLSFKGADDIFETLLKIHPILKKEYFLNPNGEDEDPYETSRMSFIIANAYGIFGVGSWRTVSEYSRFWAIGSGYEFALGAMFAAYDLYEEPEDIARAGVAAGCEFDDGSGPPITMYSIELRESAKVRSLK